MAPMPKYYFMAICQPLEPLNMNPLTYRRPSLHPADKRRRISRGRALQVHRITKLFVDDVRVLHYLHFG
jgi:hypothetical protein